MWWCGFGDSAIIFLHLPLDGGRVVRIFLHQPVAMLLGQDLGGGNAAVAMTILDLSLFALKVVL
jgi:hypothetical protein